jgi:hypothetical protein
MMPVNITTTNINEDLYKIAKKSSLDVSELYFDVNAITTYVKSANSDFYEIDSSDLAKYKEENSLRDNHIELDQEYSVRVKRMDAEYPFRHMISEIEFNEDETKAYFVIKKGAKLTYYPGLYRDFLNYITEQKLRAKIMLYLFDVDYYQSIEEFVKAIEKIKKVTFKDDKKVLIARGFSSVESVVAKICMTIEEENEIGAEDDEGKVDYANRGFLLGCSEGDQLFEFIKPQQGEYGRTCKGKLIQIESVNLDAKPTFTVNDGIEVQESFENIRYLSKKSGYLVKNGNVYDVSNSIDVNEISFKTTGTINTDLDSEISINVIKDNPLEDAVEEGMHVKVQNLSIRGSLGPKTLIETREISIDGQTHSESVIKCINAHIAHHKGKVTARSVEVETLDGGEIIADEVIIKNAMRGSIRAKTIQINMLGSHVIMQASQSIKIKQNKGEENKFIIDTSIISAFDEENVDDREYLTQLQEEIKPLIVRLKECAQKIKKNQKPCEKIKEKIIKCKKEALDIPADLIKNFKLCQVIKIHYKKQKEEYDFTKSQIEKMEKKLDDNSNIFDTSIETRQPLQGFNTIIFRLNNPSRDIVYKSDGKNQKSLFKLIEDDEGILRIVNR